MLTILPESSGKVLAIEAKGKLTDEDYQSVLIPRFNELLAKHGPLRVLIAFDADFEGWEPKAAWDDASFGFAHRKDFERFAAVGAPKWVEWGAKVGAALMSGEVKIFAANEKDAALKWIQS